MSPHYDRNVDSSAAQNEFDEPRENMIDDAAAEGAAAAMRDADIEAAKEEIEARSEDVSDRTRDEFDLSTIRPSDLDQMSIDELRVLARQLDVPDRSTITEQDELIAAIRRRL